MTLRIPPGGPLLLLVATGCGDPPPAPSECTTGTVWEGGDEESPLMHPGRDCIGCHDAGEGPTFSVAGTVMPDYGELDDCYGVDGVTVTITDAEGGVHEVVTNAAGNFWLTEPVPMPYTVVIEKDGAMRAMGAAQSEGACATCHTETGENGAPGRVLVP